MRVDIYITTKFHGKLSCGSGAYAVLLDVVLQGRCYRKLHMAGWEGLSFQKLAARAAVDGIRYMTTPSDVVVHIDSPYATNVMRSGKADGKKHEELWRAYFAAASKMNSVEVLFEKEHKHRAALLYRMAPGDYPIMQDK